MVIAPDAERVLETVRQFRNAPDEMGIQAPVRALVRAGRDAPTTEPAPIAEIRDPHALARAAARSHEGGARRELRRLRRHRRSS